MAFSINKTEEYKMNIICIVFGHRFKSISASLKRCYAGVEREKITEEWGYIIACDRCGKIIPVKPIREYRSDLSILKKTAFGNSRRSKVTK
jgi:hypothetical protein